MLIGGNMAGSWDVVVIGGGPAGMMAAIAAGTRGSSVLLVERNKRPGKKLLITGNGRCNVTNGSDIRHHLAVALCSGRFLRPSMHPFGPMEVLSFFDSRGLQMRREEDGRIFPASDRSSDVLNALMKAMDNVGVEIRRGRVTGISTEDGSVKGVVLESSEVILAEGVILATGGSSYPSTGSTGDGYGLASSLGHTITEPRPALVPLSVDGIGRADLEGLSLQGVRVTLKDGTGKRLFDERGDLIFTNRGLSGPVSLLASCYVESGVDVEMSIDLFPDVDHRDLDLMVRERSSSSPKRMLEVEMRSLVPRRLAEFILSELDVDGAVRMSQLSKTARGSIVRSLKGLKFNIGGLGPIEDAIVTRGGVSLGEVDPGTMGSRIVPNLHFAGEVLDIQSISGGYNLQLAWSTGHLAGDSVLR